MGLRGYAQRDPLVEYKLEGYNLFLEMMANIRRNTIYNVYMFQPAKVTLSCLMHSAYILQQSYTYATHCTSSTFCSNAIPAGCALKVR